MGGSRGRAAGCHKVALGGHRVGLEALGRARVKKEYQGAVMYLTELISHDAGVASGYELFFAEDSSCCIRFGALLIEALSNN